MIFLQPRGLPLFLGFLTSLDKMSGFLVDVKSIVTGAEPNDAAAETETRSVETAIANVLLGDSGRAISEAG